MQCGQLQRVDIPGALPPCLQCVARNQELLTAVRRRSDKISDLFTVITNHCHAVDPQPIKIVVDLLALGPLLAEKHTGATTENLDVRLSFRQPLTDPTGHICLSS